jgi:hypothetical protein
MLEMEVYNGWKGGWIMAGMNADGKRGNVKG